MEKVKYSIANLISIIILSTLMLVGCSAQSTTDDVSASLEFRNIIINLAAEKVIETGEVTDEFSASDVIIDKIYYGAFSQPDAEEILALCKIQNLPHVGGLDRTVAMVLTEDTLELVAYKEFSADQVVIDCLNTNSGQKKILFCGTTTYQGISSQTTNIFTVQGNEWVELSIEEMIELQEELPLNTNIEKTKDLVLTTYREWCDMYFDLWLSWPQCGNVYDSPKAELGYMVVEDENIQSIDDLKRVTEEICTPEAAKELFYDMYLDEIELYIEEDGILYRKMADGIGNLGGELLEFDIIEKREDYIHARMKYLDDLNEFTHNIELKLVNTGSKWKVDYWNQVYD